MDNDILIIPVMNDRFIYIAFENSEGEVEYTKYEYVDGGCIGYPDSDIGAIVAADNGITEYQDYDLMIKECKPAVVQNITADLIYNEINHGDKEHKEWLSDKLNEIFDNANAYNSSNNGV